jgi:hypothetical protein
LKGRLHELIPIKGTQKEANAQKGKTDYMVSIYMPKVEENMS